jgi:hypothetical protein
MSGTHGTILLGCALHQLLLLLQMACGWSNAVFSNRWLLRAINH